MASYTVEFWLILQMIIEVLLCGIIGYYVYHEKSKKVEVRQEQEKIKTLIFDFMMNRSGRNYSRLLMSPTNIYTCITIPKISMIFLMMRNLHWPRVLWQKQ